MAYANEPAQAPVPIWLFCNVYVVADNDVTIVGRARTATLSLAARENYLHNI